MIKTDEKMTDGSFYYWHKCNRCGKEKGYKNRKGKTDGYCKSCQEALRLEGVSKAHQALKNKEYSTKLLKTKFVQEGISKEAVREMFTYHPEGVLTYNDTYHPKMVKNTVAGSVHSNGFRQIKINKKSYTLNYLIWVYHYGLPEGNISHKNRIPYDNRIENLQTETSCFDTWEFIKRSLNTHGYVYDYSKVEYINNKVPVTLICKDHGEFTLTPHAHLAGKSGCPFCNPKSFDFNKSGLLYYLCIEDKYYKIGITNRSVKKRFAGEMHKIRIIQEWEYENGYDCYQKEQEIIKTYAEYAYTDEYKPLISGNTELFTKDILELDQKSLLTCSNKADMRSSDIAPESNSQSSLTSKISFSM